MGKKTVGIVPGVRLFDTDDCYLDNYVFVNSYVLRVAATGGVPLGLVGLDGYAAEGAFDRCDALLICGGRRLYPLHFQAVEHAVKTGKKLLGICLGMQAIHSYFIVADEMARRGYAGAPLALYEQMKKELFFFTEPVPHHWDVQMVRGHADEVKHPVRLTPGTQIRRLLGQDAVSGASMHHYRIGTPSPRLTVAGRTDDGTIEAVEAGSNLLGVQFHPEVDDTLDPLFRFLAEP